MESFKRSLMKSLSWRLTAMILTAGIVYVLTGSVHWAAIAGGADFVLKILAYFVHERIWNSIDYGRKYRYD